MAWSKKRRSRNAVPLVGRLVEQPNNHCTLSCSLLFLFFYSLTINTRSFPFFRFSKTFRSAQFRFRFLPTSPPPPPLAGKPPSFAGKPLLLAGNRLSPSLSGLSLAFFARSLQILGGGSAAVTPKGSLRISSRFGAGRGMWPLLLEWRAVL